MSGQIGFNPIFFAYSVRSTCCCKGDDEEDDVVVGVEGVDESVDEMLKRSCFFVDVTSFVVLSMLSFNFELFFSCFSCSSFCRHFSSSEIL